MSHSDSKMQSFRSDAEVQKNNEIKSMPCVPILGRILERLTCSCCKNSKVKPKGFKESTRSSLSQKTVFSSESQSGKDTYLSPIKFLEL